MTTPRGKNEVGKGDEGRGGSREPRPEGGKPTQRKQRPKKETQRVHSTTSAPPPPPAPITFPPQPRPFLHQPYQPYPPPHFIMNPAYPPSSINGSPYPQPGQPGHPQYPHPGTPMPPQAYAYPPIHHSPSPYPPHSYPYQYASPQMVMYGMPRPGSHEPPPPPQTTASPAPQSASAGSKRKRTSEGGRKAEDDSDEESSSAPAAQQQQSSQPSAAEMKKRTKTQRACDSCRSRKIRCDVLSEADPPVCQHCKQYGFECTFFLPITETRFKKKRPEPAGEEDKIAQVVAMAAASSSSSPDVKRDVGVFGPTSDTHLLHSQATISPRMYENYDLRYQHTWEVSRGGDGLITVEKPHVDENSLTSMPKPIEMRLERDVVEKLLNAYFTQVAPMLPVITQHEFVSLTGKAPPPILLYSMCLVAAARREVPQTVFDSIRLSVNNVIKAEDVLSTASLVNVQSLLILCMTGDCHSQFVPSALSALWIRLGTAIRMAQDLGLHRAESVRHQIELRRRVWGACVISDRWTSLTYGHPFMIDVQDCDVRLPSSGDPNDLYMDELVRLSVILGRVLKTIYSPSGLTLTTDGMLYDLLGDLEAWKVKLPENLQFRGPDSPQNAGLLHLLYACVCMIFWRVFMRISYLCPAHLKFTLTVEQWTTLVQLTGEAIDWLDNHERMYDIWLIVAYAATSCALVQYHTWARRKDDEAAAKLRKLRDCVRRWEGSLSPDHMSARRKTAEIISLLYEATQGPPPSAEQPALNPTGGVTGKNQVQLTYKKDPSRPGGGVFIAEGTANSAEVKDLPSDIVILREDESAAGTNLPTVLGHASSSGTTPVPIATATDSATVTVDARRARRRERLDREFLLSSSAFAPPLPGDEASSNNSGNSPAGAGAGTNAANTPVSTTMTSPTTHNMVNFTPLNRSGVTGGGGGGMMANVNPAMNSTGAGQGNNVQVMNLLDSSQGPSSFEQFAAADSFLDGIPGGMFDWGQWEHFFQQRQQHQAQQNTNG